MPEVTIQSRFSRNFNFGLIRDYQKRKMAGTTNLYKTQKTGTVAKMHMQGVQEVVDEDCEYRRALEGCAQGAGAEQDRITSTGSDAF